MFTHGATNQVTKSNKRNWKSNPTPQLIQVCEISNVFASCICSLHFYHSHANGSNNMFMHQCITWLQGARHYLCISILCLPIQLCFLQVLMYSKYLISYLWYLAPHVVSVVVHPLSEGLAHHLSLVIVLWYRCNMPLLGNF